MKIKLKKFLKIMVLINKLEEDYTSINDLDKKKDSYQKKIIKYMKYTDLSSKDMKTMVQDVLKVQKSYASMMKFLFEKLDGGMFELDFKQLGKEKKYIVDLKHNLQFSKMYSEYIVDKTYTEGLVAEDKIEVLATLLSSHLVKDMFNGEFNKKYVVYVPDTLYTKDNKLDQVFEMLDDELAKKITEPEFPTTHSAFVIGYGTNSNEPRTYTIGARSEGTLDQANIIAQYNSDGKLVSGKPDQETEVANKKYVDDRFNGANKAIVFNSY